MERGGGAMYRSVWIVERGQRPKSDLAYHPQSWLGRISAGLLAALKKKARDEQERTACAEVLGCQATIHSCTYAQLLTCCRATGLQRPSERPHHHHHSKPAHRKDPSAGHRPGTWPRPHTPCRRHHGAFEGDLQRKRPAHVQMEHAPSGGSSGMQVLRRL
eukprot:364772-Chlamydomonas_euryale.AAC.12